MYQATIATGSEFSSYDPYGAAPIRIIGTYGSYEDASRELVKYLVLNNYIFAEDGESYDYGRYSPLCGQFHKLTWKIEGADNFPPTTYKKYIKLKYQLLYGEIVMNEVDLNFIVGVFKNEWWCFEASVKKLVPKTPSNQTRRAFFIRFVYFADSLNAHLAKEIYHRFIDHTTFGM